MDKEPLILPIFRRLIQKAPEEKVSDIANNIKKSMEGQGLIEFYIKDERSVYVSMSEFKNEFDISCLTVSRNSDSVVLAFPGVVDESHINFFIKRDIDLDQL